MGLPTRGQGLSGAVIWIRERGVVRAIARRRKALVAELPGHFDNAASGGTSQRQLGKRATLREPRSPLRTGPEGRGLPTGGRGRTWR
ncbi:hypothetical protein GCM10009548_55950 [Streptomyces malaysiensis subsp. malaysiensis]|nr:hypothetical protein DNK48_10650 [Streptomyces malaysiensis]